MGSLTRSGQHAFRTKGLSADLSEISAPMPPASPVAMAILGRRGGFMFVSQDELGSLGSRYHDAFIWGRGILAGAVWQRHFAQGRSATMARCCQFGKGSCG